MIITDISAKNFLKYAELDLRDLPASGVIAIDGPNESGKSTIGETLCFALFGRTFSLSEDELNKLIRWGETHCSVTLAFRTGADDHYEVVRFIDRDGNHGARLSRVGDEEPFARGADLVEEALYEVLGYGYDEFIESYYLAQREITTPHPHSHAVKTMAGISSLEYVTFEYEQEIDSEQGSIVVSQAEIASLNTELEELALDEGELATLEAERNGQLTTASRLQSEIEGLDSASTAYQDAAPKIRRAIGARGRARFLRFISLVMALVAGAAWGLIIRMPDHPYTALLQENLLRLYPEWGDQHIPWLLYGAVTFVVLFLLLWIRVASKGKAIAELKVVAADLAGRLTSVDNHAGEYGASLKDDEGSTPAEMTGRPDTPGVTDFCRRVSDVLATPTEVRDYSGQELAWMRLAHQKYQEQVVHSDQKIRVEGERRRKSEGLIETREGVEQRKVEQERRVELRQLAIELLDGSCRHLSQRFNRDLREMVSKTLPMFTENRYEHLQIDDDLTVRAFSSDKRDFLDLEEISSGTQRQIMLALRLALAQKLVESTQGGQQFLFLDEPFAFFDEERTRSALSALPDLSDEVSQIWIVAQAFPEGEGFDFAINCSREQGGISHG